MTTEINLFPLPVSDDGRRFHFRSKHYSANRANHVTRLLFLYPKGSVEEEYRILRWNFSATIRRLRCQSTPKKPFEGGVDLLLRTSSRQFGDLRIALSCQPSDSEAIGGAKCSRTRMRNFISISHFCQLVSLGAGN